jgi:hypothetical protein
MVDINSVRNTVLAICNKNNYGYISPGDFNLYAKQAQLDIFNEYMKTYNYYINKENEHTSGSELANISGKVREDIELFITTGTATFVSSAATSIFTLPTDIYHTINLIYAGTKSVRISKVGIGETFDLLNSNLTQPSLEHPIYTEGSGNIAVAPPSIVGTSVLVTYVRFPADPKWTYILLQNGEPTYNSSQSDHQNFELAADEEPNLVNKILEMAGLSIREPDVYRAAQANDNTAP